MEEEIIIGIYKITSPTGRIYIGQSSNMMKRWEKYAKLGSMRGQTILHRSFVKYGYKNHIFEKLEECEFEQLNIRERYWQDFYDVIGKNGMNCVLTETNTLPRIVSDETKVNISNAVKNHFKNNPHPWTNRTHSEETKEKIRNTKLGKPVSDETREKISKNSSHYNLGGEITKEHKDKISKTRLEKGVANRGNNPRAKITLCLETGIFYDCAKDASEALEIDYKTLIAMLNKNSKRVNKTSLTYV